jgi:hypothetical protein
MIHVNHIFALEFRDADGRVLGQSPVTANWEPAVEWARFEAMRRSRLEHWPVLAAADTEILPTVHGGAPSAEGFRVIINTKQLGRLKSEFPLAWFREIAQAYSANLVKEGKLNSGETFLYRLLAFEQSEVPRKALPAFAVDELPALRTVVPVDLGALAARSVPVGESQPAEFPVFIPGELLDQAAQQTLAAESNETGGVLLGSLLHDELAAEVGLAVSALVPALHTDAKCESLTFTPETWSAVDAAISLRDRGTEILCGWAHSHPSRYWCLECPAERRRLCPLQKKGFLSAYDLTLHATMFPKPFHLALLTTNAQDGLHHTLFGWWRGQVRQRGFFQINESCADLVKMSNSISTRLFPSNAKP